MKFLHNPLILSLISVVLLSLGWLGGGGFWVLCGFVPMLCVGDIAPRRFVWYVALTLFLWMIVTCYWVSYATIIATFAVPIVGFIFMLPPWIIFHIVRKNSKPVLAYAVLVCGVVVFEWLYAYGDVSFPWLTLGNAFGRDSWAVQWYSVTGVYGGSVWILIANLLIYTAIKKRKVAYIASIWILTPIAISTLIYFCYTEPTQKVNIAIIQPNVDPYTEKFNVEPTLQTKNLLTLASSAPAGTQFFIAPETALVAAVNIDNIDNDTSVAMVRNFLKSTSSSATFIIGATTYSANEVYNSALFIDSTSTKIYHKSKLVMGVEVVPNWLTSILTSIDLGGYVGSLGRQTTRDVHAGVGAAICYESIYGNYFADWVRGGAQFMCVITNDGWWGDTPGYRQHLAQSRLRAIETRRAIARSANTGISAIIDARGDIARQLEWDQRGIISGAIPVNTAITPYVAWGDYVVRLAFFIFALSLLYATATHFRRKI